MLAFPDNHYISFFGWIKSTPLFSAYHQKNHNITPWLKNGTKKSLTVKVLFTIRQLQAEYEMQRNPGSFLG